MITHVAHSPRDYPCFAAVRGGFDPTGFTGPELILETGDTLAEVRAFAAEVAADFPEHALAHPVVRYVKITLEEVTP